MVSQDKADFFARLKRARASSKAQYLRIQAVTLQETGRPALHRAALELLDDLLANKPDPIELAPAHWHRATSLAALGRHDEAINAYRSAFTAERVFPNLKTNAYLDFGELVLALKREDLCGEVLSVLKEFGGDESFPSLQYRFNVIQALINDARGHAKRARDSAIRALEAAAKTESPFRYHRKLGLSREPNPDIDRKLRRLASTAP